MLVEIVFHELETAKRWHQDGTLGIIKIIWFQHRMLYFWSTLGAAYTQKSENSGSFALALSRYYAFIYLTTRNIREPTSSITSLECHNRGNQKVCTPFYARPLTF